MSEKVNDFYDRWTEEESGVEVFVSESENKDFDSDRKIEIEEIIGESHENLLVGGDVENILSPTSIDINFVGDSISLSSQANKSLDIKEILANTFTNEKGDEVSVGWHDVSDDTYIIEKVDSNTRDNLRISSNTTILSNEGILNLKSIEGNTITNLSSIQNGVELFREFEINSGNATIDKTILGTIKIGEIHGGTSNGKHLGCPVDIDGVTKYQIDIESFPSSENASVALHSNNGENCNLSSNIYKTSIFLPKPLENKKISYTSNKELWTTKADISIGRDRLTSSVVDGKIYCIGGYTGSSASNKVECYDPNTDTWTTKIDIPTGRYRLTSSVVDGKIYVIGGSDSDSTYSKKVECYDPNTDTWTTKIDMPTGRYGLTSSAVDGKIYCIGGYTGSTYSNKVECYDPSTDTWETKANMPTKRNSLTSVVVDGKIYCIGGNTSGNTYFNKVECYDPSTNTWTTKANVPTGRYSLTSQAVDGKIYVIGGNENVNSSSKTVECYDPNTDTWETKADMPTGRNSLTSVVVDGKIYCIGGNTSGTYSNKVECYEAIVVISANYPSELYWDYNSNIYKIKEYMLNDEDSNTWTNKANIPIGDSYSASAVVDGKIYIMSPYNNEANVYCYDPVTDTWEQKASHLPENYATAQAVGGYIYMIGGRKVKTRVQCYDPITNTWSIKANIPTGRYYLTSSVVDGKIYCIGGYTGSTYSNKVECYDPSTDTWEAFTDMPIGRRFLTSSVVDGKIYVIGGRINSSSTSNKVECYDPKTDSWSTCASMPTARSSLANQAVDGKIYCIGGNTGSSASNKVECYDPSTDTWETKANMPTKKNNLTSSVVDGKIYCIGGYTGSTYSNKVECYYVRDKIYSQTSLTNIILPISVDAFNGSTEINIGSNYLAETNTSVTATKVKSFKAMSEDMELDKNEQYTVKFDCVKGASTDDISINLGGTTHTITNSEIANTNTLLLTTPSQNNTQLSFESHGCVISKVAVTKGDNRNVPYFLGNKSSFDNNTIKVTCSNGSSTNKFEIAIQEPIRSKDGIKDKLVVLDKLYVERNLQETNGVISQKSKTYEELTLPTFKGSLRLNVYNDSILEIDSVVPPIINADYLKGCILEELKLPSNLTKSKYSELSDKFYFDNGYKIYKHGEIMDGDTWTTKADMLAGRIFLTSQAVNGKIYVIGGYTSDNPCSQKVECYDPNTDTWTTKADMLAGSRFLTSSVVDEKVYVIGGVININECSQSVECYDPNTDAWTTCASMPIGRYNLTSQVVDGKIYCIGGYTGSSDSNKVECYDPKTDTWSTCASMPTARYNLTSSVVDGKIYCIGGNAGSSNSNKVECYDPKTDTWTTKIDMPTRRYVLASQAIDGKIYVIGGRINTNSYSDKVECYDPNTDAWTTCASMPIGRGELTSSVVDGKIYVIGGSDSDSTYSKKVECYDPKKIKYTNEVLATNYSTLIKTKGKNYFGYLNANPGNTNLVSDTKKYNIPSLKNNTNYTLQIKASTTSSSQTLNIELGGANSSTVLTSTDNEKYILTNISTPSSLSNNYLIFTADNLTIKEVMIFEENLLGAINFYFEGTLSTGVYNEIDLTYDYEFEYTTNLNTNNFIIKLPDMLSDGCKFYWDSIKNHYCINDNGIITNLNDMNSKIGFAIPIREVL